MKRNLKGAVSVMVAMAMLCGLTACSGGEKKGRPGEQGWDKEREPDK